MNTELIVASLSGVVALASVAYSAQVNGKNSLLKDDLERQSAERQRILERQDVMSRFRDPLLWAAFDFQSRLYNIAGQGFLRVHFVQPHDQLYAVRSTLHVLAEYLGWVEILRHRIYFLDLGNQEANRRVVTLFARIGSVLNDDSYSDRHFQLFRSDQRAIGELVKRMTKTLMAASDIRSSVRDWNRPQSSLLGSRVCPTASPNWLHLRDGIHAW
ncbi:hypothetical protein [Streptomyces sp. NPDC005408]|uniref:hypothetical protein n=1 Tax=Streptomyces sp. NPDC005408 TaxID=3155341 RepID=UPI0033ADEBED